MILFLLTLIWTFGKSFTQLFSDVFSMFLDSETFQPKCDVVFQVKREHVSESRNMFVVFQVKREHICCFPSKT